MKNNTELRPMSQEEEIFLTKTLIENPKFFREIVDIINPNVFQFIPELRIIIGLMVDEWHKTFQPCTYEYLKYLIRVRDFDNEFEEILDEIREYDTEGKEYVIQMAKDYFTRMQYVALVNTITQYLTDDLGKLSTNFEKILKKIHSTQLNEIKLINPIDLKEQIKERNDVRIPTGIKGLDTLLDGGITRKYISLWTAPTGAGKTTIMSIVAMETAKLGYNVLYLNAEDNELTLASKMFAHLTKDKVNNFRRDRLANLSNECWDKIDEFAWQHIRMATIRTGEFGVEDIEKTLISTSKDFPIDVVVLDYFSCLKLSSNVYKNEWKAQEDAMRKLEQMAKDYNIVIHIAEQMANVGNMEEAKAKEGNKTKGSKSKEQVAPYVFNIYRSKEQKRNNKMDFEIQKARDCANNGLIIENIDFDPSSTQIDFDTCETIALDDDLTFIDE